MVPACAGSTHTNSLGSSDRRNHPACEGIQRGARELAVDAARRGQGGVGLGGTGVLGLGRVLGRAALSARFDGFSCHRQHLLMRDGRGPPPPLAGKCPGRVTAWKSPARGGACGCLLGCMAAVLCGVGVQALELVDRCVDVSAELGLQVEEDDFSLA